VKALVIEPGPSFSVMDVHRGLCSGLEQNGVTVASYNLSDRLNFYCEVELEIDGERRKALEYEAAVMMAAQGIRAACWDMLPEVVIIVSSFFMPPELLVNLRERQRHVVLWFTESPYEDERQLKQARFADTVIVNDPTNLAAFRKENPRTFYLPHCYNPGVHRPEGPKGPASDFCFVGTGYPSRVEFLEQCRLPASSVLGGHWRGVGDTSPLRPFLIHDQQQCIDNADATALYRAAKASANLYRKEALSADDVDGWAMGPREVELAATGTFFLREPRGEGDELLWMLPTFTDPGEFSDQLAWWLANDEKRIETARLARAAVSDRTFKANASELLRLISG
jgi:spore maturation protein CgeB